MHLPSNFILMDTEVPEYPL